MGVEQDLQHCSKICGDSQLEKGTPERYAVGSEHMYGCSGKGREHPRGMLVDHMLLGFKTRGQPSLQPQQPSLQPQQQM
jgi:hypothetical protein